MSRAAASADAGAAPRRPQGQTPAACEHNPVGQQISVVPHAATQLPLAQQPPLQRSTDEQLAPHLWFSHAVSTGQSAAALQPQAPPTQARPTVDELQLMHACPDAPQVDPMVPLAHVPALQHEPLPHVPSFAAPHAPVHAP